MVRLTLEGIGCRRGDRMLFDRLSLDLPPGAVLALSGPNGAGKTSLLRLIAGFLAPEAGHIAIRAGEVLAEAAEDRMMHIGWLGAGDGLKRRLSVRENIAFIADLYGSKRAALDAALAQCGLEDLAGRPCALLSAGQRRRTALAQLLVMRRPLWLLDEPFAMLDAEARALVETLLTAHGAAGHIALVAGHDAVRAASHHLTLEGLA